MRFSALFETASVKILLYLYENGEVRYKDLTKLIDSRGTLSLNIKELQEELLIQRSILTTKPIKAYYSLTEKGKEIAVLLRKIEKIEETDAVLGAVVSA
jgi:DNA-binding HxlR family transcriptional regulator